MPLCNACIAVCGLLSECTQTDSETVRQTDRQTDRLTDYDGDKFTHMIRVCICGLCGTAMVCELLPSPLEMSSDRAEKLLCTRNHSFAMMPPATQQLKHGSIILCVTISVMSSSL